MAKPIMSVEEWRALVARTREVLEHPGLIDIICTHVADGGSLLDLAKEWEVKYSDLLRWIRNDPSLTKAYDKALSDRNEHVIEDTLHVLNCIKSFDIRTLYDSNGKLKEIKDWPEDASKVVSSIKPTEYGNEVKMAERLKAIEFIGKNKHLFSDKHVHEVGDSLAALISDSYERGTRELEERRKQQEADTRAREVGPGIGIPTQSPALGIKS